MNNRKCYRYKVGLMAINIICGFDVSRELSIPPDFFKGKIFVDCCFRKMVFPPGTDFSGTLFVDPDFTDAVLPDDVLLSDTHILAVDEELRLHGMSIPRARFHNFVEALDRAILDTGFYRTPMQRARIRIRDLEVMLLFGFNVRVIERKENRPCVRVEQLSLLSGSA